MPASRTPEGYPSRCPLCGASVEIEYSETGGDAPCPHCGTLLLRAAQIAEKLRSLLRTQLGLAETVDVDDLRMSDLGADSLDLVELVMELEEDFPLDLSDEQLQNVETLGDLIRAILKGGAA